jgi:hypothetical protein
MKSQVNDSRAQRTLLISEHYKFMKNYADRIKATILIVQGLRQGADDKGLEYIESHLQDATYSLLAAYATISDVFTNGQKLQIKEK